MPFSSGTFSVYTPGNPVVSGTTISSVAFNNTMNDIATGLSTCVLKDGTQTTTAAVPFAAGISVGAAAAFAMNSSGVVTTSLNISNAAAGQVVFPATQNASSGANTLDDYQESEWTPALAFGGGSTGLTYTSRVGREIKIGKMVHIAFNIVVNDNGSSSGAATISGLTHAAETITSMQWSTGGYGEGLNAAGAVSCTIASGGSSISLTFADTTGAASLTEVEIVNGAQLACSMTYQAAA